jgi:hypothetical protein
MSNRGIQLIEEEAALELQHINIKLPLKNPQNIDVHTVVPVFHEWIQQQITHELLLDVASYAHVKNGPGILLIGHEADYSLDLADGRPGLRYNRKAAAAGDNQARLEQSVNAALEALHLLENDPRTATSIQFDGRGLELFINDRILAPNRPETRLSVDPILQSFFRRLLRGEAFSIDYEADPRKLFGAQIEFQRELTVDELRSNLVRSPD